jgi:hypothetical protein
LTVVVIARGLPPLPVVRWARPGTSYPLFDSVELSALARAMALP